jgi:hypothetical protein
MSYHDGIGIPPLSETGCVAAVGSTNLACGRAGDSICATSDHPAAVSPKPCIRKTRAVGGGEERGPTVVGRGWEGRGLAPSRMEAAAEAEEEEEVIARAAIDGGREEWGENKLGKNPMRFW